MSFSSGAAAWSIVMNFCRSICVTFGVSKSDGSFYFYVMLDGGDFGCVVVALGPIALRAFVAFCFAGTVLLTLVLPVVESRDDDAFV